MKSKTRSLITHQILCDRVLANEGGMNGRIQILYCELDAHCPMVTESGRFFIKFAPGRSR